MYLFLFKLLKSNLLLVYIMTNTVSKDELLFPATRQL